MDLDEAVTQLYALSPDEFLAARGRLAASAKAHKETGLAKAIASVRKPTAAAWAVNQLVRERPDDLDRLRSLATALHDAQDAMDGAALKTLGRERTSLVDTLVRATAEVARDQGGALSASVANQVRETFVAALASTAAAEAAGSGQLTRALSYAGFGDVDLSEATAAPPPARRPALRVIEGEGGRGKDGHPAGQRGRGGTGKGHSPSPGGTGRPARPAEEPEPSTTEPDPQLLRQLKVAETRSRETMSEAAKAGDALADATEALETLDARIAQLDADLKSARAERDALVRARKDAVAAEKTAGRTLRAVLAEVDQLRSRLPDDS